jgi:hypothetical protein
LPVAHRLAITSGTGESTVTIYDATPLPRAGGPVLRVSPVGYRGHPLSSGNLQSQIGNHLGHGLPLDVLHGVEVNAALAADAEDGTMLVWCNCAAACASFLKRCSCFGSMTAAKGSTFKATRRPSEICSASKTIPMPPRPTSRMMR